MANPLRSFSLLLCIFCFTSFGYSEELRLSAGGAASLLDKRILPLSRAALGADIGVDLEDALLDGLGVGLRASWLGFIPAVGDSPSVDCLSCVLSAGFLWKLGTTDSRLGCYGEAGYGALMAAMPGQAPPLSGGFAAAGAGLRYRLDITRALALEARLGGLALFERSTAWFNPELRLGFSFRFLRWDPVTPAPLLVAGPGSSGDKPAGSPPETSPAALDREKALRELKARSDIRVIDSSASGAEGQRLVMCGIFEANKVSLTKSFAAEYPFVLRYLKSLDDLASLEVRGFVADDGTVDDGLILSGERARFIEALLVKDLEDGGIAVRAVGMGRADILTDDATAQGRARNRRVEIIIHVRDGK